MTSTKITPAQAAARATAWTAEQRAAYHVGLDQAASFHFGYADGQQERSPYGDLSGPRMGGLLDALGLTGPGKPRTNAAYRDLLAGMYRGGRQAALEAIATEWCECDDEALNDLAELGYDDEATS